MAIATSYQKHSHEVAIGVLPTFNEFPRSLTSHQIKHCSALCDDDDDDECFRTLIMRFNHCCYEQKYNWGKYWKLKLISLFDNV